ncbi:MAG: AraC family transcriptional regulator [Bacteroidia bacterium]
MIDTADMAEFNSSLKIARPSFYIIVAIKHAIGKVEIDMETYYISDNTLLFIAPGTRVNIEKLNIIEAIWLFFEGEFLDFFFQDKFFTFKFNFFHGPKALIPLPLTGVDFEDIHNLFRQIHSEKRAFKEDSHHFLRSSLYLLLIKLNRHYGTTFYSEGNVISDGRVLQFKQLLEKNIKELKTVQEFADKLGISKTYLNKLCQLHFSKPCSDLIAERTVLETKQSLIYSSADIAEIAYDYGFSEPSNFIRFFKKHTNTTPSAFRKEFSN